MSEFDKEAEREKLREKFARDEEKREHTQRMSELLLKGATMTNQHCNNCGDPIFRHDGDEFCPTCGGAAAEQAADVPERDTEIETAEKSLDSAQAARDGAPAGPQAAETGETSADASTQSTPPMSDPSSRRVPPSQQSGQSAAAEAGSASPADGSAQQTGSGRAELQRALSTAAANAAAAEDPRTAKAWLEAAREAAEALSALDR